MEAAREAGGRGQEQVKSMVHKMASHAPSSRQVVRVVTFSAGLVTILAIVGLMLSASALTLLLATPMFLFLSPVLVPLGILVFMLSGGFLSAEAAFVAVTSALSWIYSYFKGRHPLGAHQVDSAKTQLLDTAGHVKDLAKEYGSTVISTAQELAPHS